MRYTRTPNTFWNIAYGCPKEKKQRKKQKKENPSTEEVNRDENITSMTKQYGTSGKRKTKRKKPSDDSYGAELNNDWYKLE